MSKGEPNWSAFYQRLRQLGPRMLKGVPKDYRWWVEETSEGTDLFWPGTQDIFYTWWSWAESLEDKRQAVVRTLKLWANNVRNETEYMADVVEQPPKKSRIIRQIRKMRLAINDDYVDRMLADAQSPIVVQVEGEEVGTDKDDIPVEVLSFELLPKGSSEVSDIISQLNKRMSSGASKHQVQVIDESRLAEIRSLGPDKCYIGCKEWSGYALFEFSSRDRVILECPIEGNATYILAGDWKELVQHSKLHLRRDFPNRCERVFHQGDWLDRVRKALDAPYGSSL